MSTHTHFPTTLGAVAGGSIPYLGEALISAARACPIDCDSALAAATYLGRCAYVDSYRCAGCGAEFSVRVPNADTDATDNAKRARAEARRS